MSRIVCHPAKPVYRVLFATILIGLLFSGAANGAESNLPSPSIQPLAGWSYRTYLNDVVQGVSDSELRAYQCQLEGAGVIAIKNLPKGSYRFQLSGAELQNARPGERVFRITTPDNKTVTVDWAALSGLSRKAVTEIAFEADGDSLEFTIESGEKPAVWTRAAVLNSKGTMVARFDAAKLPDVRITPERIDEIARLLPKEPTPLGPVIRDRAAWKVFADQASVIVQNADQMLKEPTPELSEELYLVFSKKGTREEYGKPFFRRIERLGVLTLAECATDQGTYMPAIIKELEAILAEKTWVMPAHDGDLSNYYGKRMDVELAACMRAGTIGTSVGWLGDKLPGALRERVLAEMQRRIFDPYLHRIRTGQGACGWVNEHNNWNAVCHAGVVIAALSILPDVRQRAEIVAGAEYYLPNYLTSFTRDGYCTEGLGYWGYGFGHYVFLAEAVLKNTGGKINFYQSPLVRAIVDFPQNLEMAPEIYPAFSDSELGVQPWSAPIGITRARLYNQELPQQVTTPGSMLYLTAASSFPLYVVPGTTRADQAPPLDPLRGWFPVSGILVCRPGDRDIKKMAVAIKGGDNSAGHHHNDLGQFVVTVNGKVPIIDPGLEPYTAQTWGPGRYDFDLLSSYGHAVPLVAGKKQVSGASAVAKVLRTEFTPQQDTLTFDLSRAYRVETLSKLERTYVYSRKGVGELTVTDEVEYTTPETFGSALITYGKVALPAPDTIVISDGSGCVRVKVSTKGTTFKITSLPLKTQGSHAPTRIGIDLNTPVTRETVTLHITVAEGPALEESIAVKPAVPKSLQLETGKAIRVEAENFSREENGRVSIISKVDSSKSAISKWDDNGHSLTWNVQAPAEGLYAIRLRYCSGVSFDSKRILSINGVTPSEVSEPLKFTSTGGWSSDRSDWHIAWVSNKGIILPFVLKAGKNELTLTNAGNGGVNLDWLEFVPVHGTPAK